jgi:hypothetical protein
MPVTWGLLSTARINRALLAAANESDRNDVVAVASRSEDRARAYADEHGIARAYGSYEALLAGVEPGSGEWLDLIEVPLSRRAPQLGQPENWTLAPGQWRMQGTSTTMRLANS